MTQPIRKFLALPSTERRILVEALVALPLIALAIATLGATRCYRCMARIAPTVDASTPRWVPTSPPASRVASLVAIAARRVPLRASCLVRSMTTWWLLRRRHLQVELHIGVRKRRDRLEAHAWVEHAGAVLDDDACVAEGYVPLLRTGSVFERRRLETP